MTRLRQWIPGVASELMIASRNNARKSFVRVSKERSNADGESTGGDPDARSVDNRRRKK